MMNDKLYLKGFIERNRENLRSHLNAGYVNYSKEGYLTLIKIIADEINNPHQDQENLKDVAVGLANEIKELRFSFDDEVYRCLLDNKEIINFIKKYKEEKK